MEFVTMFLFLVYFSLSKHFHLNLRGGGVILYLWLATNVVFFLFNKKLYLL